MRLACYPVNPELIRANKFSGKTSVFFLPLGNLPPTDGKEHGPKDPMSVFFLSVGRDWQTVEIG